MKNYTLLTPRRLAMMLSLAAVTCSQAQDNFLQNIYEDHDYRQRGLFEGLASDEVDADEKGGEGEKFTDLLHFSLAGGLRYDSNIFLQESNEEDDFIFTVTPTFSIISGREGTAQNTYSLSYAPSLLFYADNSDQNRVDHRATFRFTKQLPKSKIALDLDFSDTEGSSRYASGAVARTRLHGALHYNYLMSGKTRLDLVASTDLNNFKTSGFNDQYNYGLRASVMYQLTGKTAIGPSFSYTHTDVTDGVNQDAYDFGMKVDYLASGKTTLTGTMGYNVRTFDGTGASSDLSTMSWSVGARYQATGKTSLRGTFYREPKVSFNFQNTGYMATGVSFNANHQYSARMNLFAMLSYENDDYYDTGAGGISLENNYYTATMGANYQMQNGLTLGANMTYRTNQSNSSFNEFDGFSCGINASYNFW